MTISHLHYWLAALYAPHIGPRSFLKGLSKFIDIENLFQANEEAWRAAGFNQKQIEALQYPNWQVVEKDLQWMQKENHHLIALTDERYPAILKEMVDPPLVLYVKGNVDALSQIQIAMVGSRHPSRQGIKQAEEFAYAIAEAGIAVTSGLAMGIDGASHRGALAAKGVTIAVFGTGLQHVYPACHRELAFNILDHHGALVSEFPPTTCAIPANFPRRNRVISGLSIGVLVVEAALKSGSLITARYALEQGRDVFAIPGSIHHPLAKGCHYLIRQGATLVETVLDILEETRGWHQASLKPLALSKAISVSLTIKEQQVFQQIGYETTLMDVIICQSGLTASEVSSILITLELHGYIQSVPGGYARAGTV